MKKIMLLLLALSFVGCSSAVKRTRDSDKGMRVMIDPETISAEDHVAIQNALVESGKFYVVDRSKAYKALKKEQERQQRTEADRFDDRQKYAHWGKLYGAGSVVVAHAQCAPNNSQLNVAYFAFHLATLDTFWKQYKCTQFLQIVDTNTSQIIASVSKDVSSDSRTNLDWSSIVDDMTDAYPEYFEVQKKHKNLDDYESLSAEEAQRSRELANGL